MPTWKGRATRDFQKNKNGWFRTCYGCWGTGRCFGMPRTKAPHAPCRGTGRIRVDQQRDRTVRQRVMSLLHGGRAVERHRPAPHGTRERPPYLRSRPLKYRGFGRPAKPGEKIREKDRV